MADPRYATFYLPSRRIWLTREGSEGYTYCCGDGPVIDCIACNRGGFRWQVRLVVDADLRRTWVECEGHFTQPSSLCMHVTAEVYLQLGRNGDSLVARPVRSQRGLSGCSTMMMRF